MLMVRPAKLVRVLPASTVSFTGDNFPHFNVRISPRSHRELLVVIVACRSEVGTGSQVVEGLSEWRCVGSGLVCRGMVVTGVTGGVGWGGEQTPQLDRGVWVGSVRVCWCGFYGRAAWVAGGVRGFWWVRGLGGWNSVR